MMRLVACFSLLAAGWCALPWSAAAEDNFPIAPGKAETLFASGGFEILEAERTASGVAGAQKWKLRFDDGTLVKAKWKAAPPYTTDGWNNSPRREIAAYHIQKWFLDEDDYIVPPSEVRCVPLDQYRRIAPRAEATMRGTDCVYGVLSLWLQGVEEPDEIWDEELFEEDEDYRESIAAMNVLTFLIGHQDGRPANFLWDADDHHVFSIDNGISFGAFPYNFLVENWNSIRVPGIPAEVARRLDKVTPADIERLAILRELHADDEGVLRTVPPTINFDPDRGTRTRAGALQFGLSQREVGQVKERLTELLRRIESGELAVF